MSLLELPVKNVGTKWYIKWAAMGSFWHALISRMQKYKTDFKENWCHLSEMSTG